MQFTREYKNTDGTTSVWYYDHSKSQNGPIKVEIGYANDKTDVETIDELKDTSRDTSISLTKRMWTNPANGKLVGYTRAKNHGLVKS
jgi:hypothetical protein